MFGRFARARRAMETQTTQMVPLAGELRGVQRLNHRHDAIITWLIENPQRKLGECAKELGYTQTWLSIVVHSDLFQLEYQRLARERGEIAVHSSAARLGRIADLGMAAIERRLELDGEKPVGDSLLLGATNSALEKLGFLPASAKTQTIVNNGTLIVNQADLAQAREAAAAAHAKVIELAVESPNSKKVAEDE